MKRSGVHAVEEIVVRLCLLQFVEQEFDRVHCPHRIENPAQNEGLLETLRRDEQFFLTRTGPLNVDRRINTLVGDFPIQDDFGVTRTLELFEDNFIHPAAGIDQRRCDDGE